MHVILMSDRLGRTVAFNLGHRHLGSAAALLIGVLIWSGFMGFHLGRHERPAAAAKPIVSAQGPRFDQLAIRVGELQARLAQINDMGDRLAKKVGVPVRAIPTTVAPGEGGPLVSTGERSPTSEDIAMMLDELSGGADTESDRLTVMDSEFLHRTAHPGHLPLGRPIGRSAFISSGFGMRIDPFTGKLAFHPGLDFADKVGTPIRAAAAGVVIDVEKMSPGYGNQIEIDHGNGLVTRYAHCSKLLAKQGDVVKRGQEIAEVGSTGRSTGPHLHFEVRKFGVAENPVPFLSRRSLLALRGYR